MSKESMTCTICKTEESLDNPVISTGEFNICMSCTEVASYLITFKETNRTISLEEYGNKETKKIEQIEQKESNYTPKDIKDILDKFVIGQEEAKKVLSVGVYNHIKRINDKDSIIDKSNILLIGPTGSGKTFLAETISKNLDIPLAIVNTTSLTAAGYVGEDVSSVLERLWINADYNVEKAEKGIIFLDEIDKNRTSGGGTNNKDVSGKAVQQELLKLLEGDTVKIYPEGDSNNKKAGDSISINTKDILFIAGGAFVGLKDEDGVKINSLGEFKEYDNEVPDTEDLIKYGMIPEFIGRFPMIVELDGIDFQTMRKIMVEPKNSIVKQYKNLFALSKVELDFDDKAINEISNIALTKNTGARGLRNVMENIMIDYMFNIEEYTNKKVSITYSYNKFKRESK